jgi:autotransporter-associated beta strand protein
MKADPFLLGAGLALAGLLTATLNLPAATRHWTGASGTNWTTAANWSNNVAPAQGDILIFPATAANRTNFNDFTTAPRLDRLDVNGAYEISGNLIVLTNGIRVSSASSPAITIHNPIRLLAAQTFLVTGVGAGNPQLILRGSVDLNSFGLTIEGAETVELARGATGSGAVVKRGTGTLMVSGNAGFTGTLALQEGTLRVDGAVLNALVDAEFGTTLTGTGRVHGAEGEAGISPGNNGPGQFTSTTNLAMSSPFRVDLFGTNAASEYDQLRVLGTVRFPQGTRLEVNLGFQPRVGDAFTIIDNDGTDAVMASSFAGLPAGAIFSTNGYSFQLSLTGGDGNDVVLTTVRRPDSPIGIWDGGSSDSFWSTATNWVNDVVPAPGQHLRFPLIGDRTSTNNLAAGTSFASLHFAGSNYVLRGNAIAITGGITNVASTGINTCQVALAISGPLPVHSENSVLSLQSPISGGGGLVKHGVGEVRLVGSLNNTYTGETIVNAGTLRLTGAPGQRMVPGPLIIGDGVGTDTVLCNEPGQILDTAPVTIRSSGLLNLNGNNHTLGTLTLDGGSVASGAGVIRLGGNLVAGASATTASISGLLNLNGQNLGISVGDGPLASDLVISAVINNGGVNKLGAGTLELTGNNTYAGPTTVSSGRLLVNGTQASSTVTLNGGTLGGNGTIGPLSANIGAVSPGTSAGRLTVNGNANLGFLSTLYVELNGLASGTGYDQLSVNGVVNLSGGTLAGSVGFLSTAGNAFTIVLNDGTDSVQGTFAGLPQGAVFLLGGTAFSISYTGGTGNDVVLTRVVGPSTLSGAARLGNGQFRFQGMGEPSLTYIIQAHTNLNTTNWLTLGVAPADGSGLFQFLDVNAPQHPRRFYRAISP